MTMPQPLGPTDWPQGQGEAVVGVIVPAYNAAQTLGATLDSIRSQTYADLDIVVVDDGSTDATCVIAMVHAAADPRIRLVTQANAGVSAARNAGAAATTAAFLAFLDADDLWAPEKIARQMEAMAAGGPTVGLAYTWSAQIDEKGQIVSLGHTPTQEGWVLKDLCRVNFLNNGSCFLVRREAFERAGGFDPAMRAEGAEGCEDWLLCLRIAESHQFRVVKDHLTGYRQGVESLSSNARRMLKSYAYVHEIFAQRQPELVRDLEHNRRQVVVWLLYKAVAAGRWSEVALLAPMIWSESRALLMIEAWPLLRSAVAARVPRGLKRLYRRARPRPPFAKSAPSVADC